MKKMYWRLWTAWATGLGLGPTACFYDPTGTAPRESSGTTSTAGPVVAETSGEDSGTTSTGLTETGDGGTSSGATSTGSASTGVPDESTSTSTTGGPPDTCGDYLVQVGEECDQGPLGGPSCTKDCKIGACGDGEQNFGEECDDGNLLDGDICVDCKAAYCGDGALYINVESCDDGGESPTCNSDCSLAVCGDKKLNASAGEVCDLGQLNGYYGSGCGADCSSPGPLCGDGLVNAPDERCDPGVPLPWAQCDEGCQEISCELNRGDCDDEIANGCEVDFMTDDDHCGGCDKPCNVFQCISGECMP